MQHKKDIILAATASGFFRCKTDEAKESALMEAVEALPEIDEATIRAELLQETHRRSEAYKKRLAAKISREIEQENKPVTAGNMGREFQTLAGSRFIVTVAQNNTDVHGAAFAALRKFAEVNAAQLLVCKTYYNKAGFNHPEHGADDAGIYFDPALATYFVNEPVILGDSGALLVSDANVIPTAKNPLTGFEGMGVAGQDVIIPAVKIALKCTPALKGAKGKRLFSTGSVTLRNYVMRKAGAVAEADHNIGALIVMNGDIRHVEIMADSNGFNYETEFYTGSDVETVQPVALQFGDVHAEKCAPVRINAAIKMLNRYNPDNVILHDLMDFSSRNHHNIKDAAFVFGQMQKGASVVTDCNKVINFLEAIGVNYDGHIHVIESNHDLALERWLKEADFKDDPLNAEFYLAAMGALYASIREKGKGHNVLEHTLCSLGGAAIYDGNCESLNHISDMDATVIFHDTDESLILGGVEMGYHGHTGCNGAKGTPEGFRKLGIAMNTGHTHTPSITGRVYTAGVLGDLDMGYNIGASSWQHAHILTYANGQRAVVFE